jgi:hypothetical protein
MLQLEVQRDDSIGGVPMFEKKLLKSDVSAAIENHQLWLQIILSVKCLDTIPKPRVQFPH